MGKYVKLRNNAGAGKFYMFILYLATLLFACPCMCGSLRMGKSPSQRVWVLIIIIILIIQYIYSWL